MELKINYTEILELIKQLPQKELLKLLGELRTISKNSEQPDAPKESLSDKLLRGPVMDDEQFEAFKENRKSFSKWRNL